MFFFGRRLQKSAVNAICVGVIVVAFLWAVGCVWQYTQWADQLLQLAGGKKVGGLF